MSTWVAPVRASSTALRNSPTVATSSSPITATDAPRSPRVRRTSNSWCSTPDTLEAPGQQERDVVTQLREIGELAHEMLAQRPQPRDALGGAPHALQPVVDGLAGPLHEAVGVKHDAVVRGELD